MSRFEDCLLITCGIRSAARIPSFTVVHFCSFLSKLVQNSSSCSDACKYSYYHEDGLFSYSTLLCMAGWGCGQRPFFGKKCCILLIFHSLRDPKSIRKDIIYFIIYPFFNVQIITVAAKLNTLACTLSDVDIQW